MQITSRFLFLIFLLSSSLVRAEFCNWSASEKIFRIEQELARKGRFEGDSILRTENLMQLRQNQTKGSLSSDRPDTLVGKHSMTSSPVDRLSGENVNSVFTQPLDSGAKGAKAIVYRDTDGTLKPLFWKTYDENLKVPNQVHHRDAVSSVLKARAENVLNEAKNAKSPGATNFLTEEAAQIEKAANLIGGPSGSRSVNSFQNASLEEFEGFQFSSIQTKQGPKITKFEVSSSITTSEASHGAESINIKGLAEKIASIDKAIDPNLKAYHSIDLDPRVYDAIKKQGQLGQLKKYVESFSPTISPSIHFNRLPK